MDLNELTPELFEKAEFTERRRGYDIDQVERFLEETGTAVAQLLVDHRQLEERAAQAEARLADAEHRLQAAPQVEAAPVRPVQSAGDEAAEIEHATSTLLMAKRTADATIGEAEATAAQIRSEATAGAERVLADARAAAEAELAASRSETLDLVAALEERRDALAAVVHGFEQRIGSYRQEIGAVAEALLSMTEDPEALATRAEMSVPTSAAGYAADDLLLGEADSVDLTDATSIHDTATAAREGADWVEGSWSEVSTSGTSSQAAAPDGTAGGTHAGVAQAAVVQTDVVEADVAVEASVRESSVIVDAEPVTGQTSDRFLRELDEAVNESQSTPGDSEQAMTAFFEGDSDEQGRSRFGWRR